MTTRKQSAAAKAKQEDKAKAAATEAQPQEQAEPVPEAAADAVSPSDEQEAQASEDEAADTEASETEAPKPTEIQGNTITGNGTGTALPELGQPEIDAISVRTKRRIKSRRRAGHRFNREPTLIALELLTPEQLQQLIKDPALETMYCSVPVEGTSEPEA